LIDNCNGFPIQSVGTIDVNHHWKRIALAVTRYEDQTAFEKLLNVLKDALSNFFGFVWQPLYSVPDSAGAIQNALVEVFRPTETFGGVQVFTCYFHNKQALNNPVNKARFSSEQNRAHFESDIERIHGLSDTAAFCNAITLFKRKWIRKEKDATAWYMQHWGSSYFHCGATPPGLPITNCILEADNRSLKMYVTEHTRLAMGTFLKFLKEELQFQSNEQRKHAFQKHLLLTRQEWGRAQLWLKSGIKKNIRSSQDGTKFYVPSTKFMKQNPNANLQVLRNGIYNNRTAGSELVQNETFDDFIERATAFYTACLLPEELKMCNECVYSCTCIVFFKRAMCKHALGISIWKGGVEIPAAFKVNSLEQLKKRGRPAKVKDFMKKT
jgi:hypothetical protein